MYILYTGTRYMQHDQPNLSQSCTLCIRHTECYQTSLVGPNTHTLFPWDRTECCIPSTLRSLRLSTPFIVSKKFLVEFITFPAQYQLQFATVLGATRCVLRGEPIAYCLHPNTQETNENFRSPRQWRRDGRVWNTCNSSSLAGEHNGKRPLARLGIRWHYETQMAKHVTDIINTS